jgi:hypothetical protein
MAANALVEEVELLVDQLATGRPIELGAIRWAAPVVSFGDPQESTVATLGLNPSNLEFVTPSGEPLLLPHRRFESLESLGIDHWRAARRTHSRRIWTACADYFSRNPYDAWFRRLDALLVGLGVSYYPSLMARRACHLDLVPYSTTEKWSSLGGARRELESLGLPSLLRTLKASSIQVLILNGSGVVRSFERSLGVGALCKSTMPAWSLQGGRIGGEATFGRIRRIDDIDLGREILVLGFNHNIQSSYGVTRNVIAEIRDWLATSAESTRR